MPTLRRRFLRDVTCCYATIRATRSSSAIVLRFHIDRILLTIRGFHRHLIALDPRHFLDVLVAGSVHYYQLKSEFDARFSIAGSAVVSSWLCAGERF